MLKKAINNKTYWHCNKEIKFKNSWITIIYTLIYFPAQNWDLNCIALNHLDSMFIHLYFIHCLKYILNMFSWYFFAGKES